MFTRQGELLITVISHGDNTLSRGYRKDTSASAHKFFS